MRTTLYHVSYGLLRTEQDRLDAVQETITRAWAGRHSLRNDGAVRAWLTRILVNTCRQMGRRAARHQTVPLDHADIPAPPGADPAVHDAVLALPDAQRLTVILHYMDGFSVDEIAAILRVARGTVASRLHRARAALCVALGPEEEYDG